MENKKNISAAATTTTTSPASPIPPLSPTLIRENSSSSWDNKYVSETSFCSPISTYNQISSEDVGGDIWAAKRWNDRATQEADFWCDASIPMYLYQNKGYGDLSAVLRRSEALVAMCAAYRHALKDGQYSGEQSIFTLGDIYRRVCEEFRKGFRGLGNITDDYNRVGRLTMTNSFGNNNINYIEIGDIYQIMVTIPGDIPEFKYTCLVCKKYSNNYCDNSLCSLRACAVHANMPHDKHSPLCPLYYPMDRAYVKASSTKTRAYK